MNTALAKKLLRATLRSRTAASLSVLACGAILGVGARYAFADVAPAAGEQVPRTFTYRGQLSLSGGASAGSSRLMRFSLYRTIGAQTAEFSESKTVALDPADGSFATDIGECAALACTGNLQAVLEAPQPSVYLGVAVCNGTFSNVTDCSSWVELSGRQRLLSSLATMNTTGQVLGYARTPVSAGCVSGSAGSWIVAPISLTFTPSARARLVVRYVANVQGSGSLTAAVGSVAIGSFLPFSSEAMATARSGVTYEGTAMRGGSTIDHTFVLTGQTDPLTLSLAARVESGVPKICDDGASYIEVTAYAE
jgi:hypothetical protein